MPDFGSGSPTPFAGLALDRPTLPSLQIDLGKGAGGDLLAALGAAATRPVPAAAPAMLHLEAFAIGLGLAAPGLETPADRRVGEAKQAIGKEQYADALAVLVSVLRDAPDHAEGRYLAAYCQLRLDQPLEALKTLRPLRASDATRRLHTRVDALVRDIRAAVEPSVVENCSRAIREGGAERVLPQLRELVDGDPAGGMYHYFHAAALLTAGRADDGLAALRAGLAASDPEYHDRLRGLLRTAEQFVARERLAPARASWRQAHYARARAELQRLGPAFRQMALWQVFDRLLASAPGGLKGLLGMGPAPGTDRAPGTVAEMNLLYEFLLEEEVGQARTLLALGMLGEAEAVLAEVGRLAPHYPFGRFLAGIVLYRAMEAASARGVPIPLEVLVGALEQVRERARVGCTDPEIPAAPELLRTAEALLERFAAARRDRELFEAVAAEYAAAMDRAAGGIRSEEHAREVRRALEAVRGRIPGLRRGIQSAGGQEAVNRFEEQVDGNLRQLDELAAGWRRMAAVNALAERFTGRVAGLQRSPIRTRDELEGHRTFFQNLRAEVEAARRAADDAAVRQNLTDLHQAVTRILAQFPA